MIRRALYLAAATAGAIAFITAPAAAQTIIAPVSGVIDSSGPGFGTLAETINQAGLSSNYVSGVTNFDSYLATNPTHTTTFAGFEWFGNSGTTTAVVTYDFGTLVTIDRLALWNEESSGIGSLGLSLSSDGLSFGSLGTFSPTDNPLADYSADVFSFAASTGRFVRFDMSGCPQADPGSFPSCAIGEVAFRTAGAVPEPATWAMMIVGFGLLGSALRTSRRRTGSAFA